MDPMPGGAAPVTVTRNHAVLQKVAATNHVRQYRAADQHKFQENCSVFQGLTPLAGHGSVARIQHEQQR